VQHGTWISWDGRVAEHCTAVATVAEGDSLLSLFASLPEDLCTVREREEACRQIIAARMTQGTHGGGAEELFSQLKLKMKVMLRWVPDAIPHLSANGRKRWGRVRFRWLRCVVVDLDEESGTVEVREEASPYWVHPRLSSEQLWNGLVIGHR
jgi:hypothetical protein